MAGYEGDKVLRALELAVEIWDKCVMAEKLEKLEYAEKLHHFAVFSLPQIASVVRLNPRFVYAELTPNSSKGGRFDASTLSTLVRIRSLFLAGEDVPANLVRIGVQGGTSYTCLVSLTGIPYSKYYEVARQATEPVKSAPMKDSREVQERRASVLGLREKGLTQKEIATATGLDQPLVSRILRGLR